MSRCQHRLPVFIGSPIAPVKVTVTSYNLFVFWIPYNKLSATIFHGVEFININSLSCASSRCAKRNFAQSTNLSHDMRTFDCRYHINIIVTLIRCAKLAFRRQLTLEKRLTDGLDNLFFHIPLLVRFIRHAMPQDPLVHKPCFQHIVPTQQVYVIDQTFAKEWAFLSQYGNSFLHCETSRLPRKALLC